MLYTSDDNSGAVKVLQFLKAHKEEYLSGEDLSEVLKISRVAIWKHIKKIQNLGYKIESKQNLGYKLIDITDLALPWEITDGLKTKAIGKKIYYFDSIGSTQAFASNMASDPLESGSVIMAGVQTAGKGRLGRKWVSPKGGIWLSVILRPEFDVSKITLVPLAASVALASSIQKALGVKTELRWPNDVTSNGKKVAGMIIDATIESSKIESIVLGIGINYKVSPSEIERKIASSGNFYGVATLIRDNNAPKPAKFIQLFLEELERILESLNGGRTQSIITQWTKRSSTIGKHVSISTQDGKVSGTAVKIDSDGGLIVKHGKDHTKIAVGDIIQR